MAKTTKKGVVRIPKESTLEALGISRASTSALTRRFASPMEFSNEIKIHDSVLKMYSSVYSARETSEKTNDKRIEHTLQMIKSMSGGESKKIEELMKNKEKYKNNVKLSHEIELENKRKEGKKKLQRATKVSIDNDENKKAQSIYASEINTVKVNTGKNIKPKKADINNQVQDELKMSDEIKKLRVSMIGGSKKEQTVDLNAMSKNSDFLSPSTLYFAKELGWIEDDRGRKIQSPLKEYVASDSDSSEVDEENDRSIIEESSEDENETQIVKEMDLAEIQRLERKYKKEAELIRKQMEKQNSVAEKTIDNISNIYGKLLGNSPAVKILNKKSKTIDLSGASKDIDISKIPSFVLNQQKENGKEKK